MANPTARRPRTTPPAARQARGRARPSARPSRGTSAPSTGMRATAQRRAATLAAARRRKEQPTGVKGLVSKLPSVGPIGSSKRKSSSKNPIQGLVSALPTGGGAKGRKSSSGGGGKRAGGAALLAGAAGLALKNRDKIGSLVGRGGGQGDGGSAPERPTADAGTDNASVSRLDVTPTDVTTPPPPGTSG